MPRRQLTLVPGLRIGVRGMKGGGAVTGRFILVGVLRPPHLTNPSPLFGGVISTQPCSSNWDQYLWLDPVGRTGRCRGLVNLVLRTNYEYLHLTYTGGPTNDRLMNKNLDVILRGSSVALSPGGRRVLVKEVTHDQNDGDC